MPSNIEGIFILLSRLSKSICKMDSRVFYGAVYPPTVELTASSILDSLGPNSNLSTVHISLLLTATLVK